VGSEAYLAFLAIWPTMCLLLLLLVASASTYTAALKLREARLLPRKESPKVPTSVDAEAGGARPQVIRTCRQPHLGEQGVERAASQGNIAVWPSHWGITLAQCKEFLAECQSESGWDSGKNLYQVVEEYIKPRTAGTGLGLALLLNEDAPLEVNVMVSHAWSENVEEFVRALELSVSADDVMFICAFALYQCEDGAGPSIPEQLGTTAAESPFHKVLKHICGKGKCDGLLWRWCEYLWILPALCSLLALSMLVGPIISTGCIPTFDEDWDIICIRSEATEGHERFRLGAIQGQWATDERAEDAPQLYTDKFCIFGSIVCAACAMLIRCVLRFDAVYRGRMMVVPNRQSDIYGRLWCVYEIFVASTLAMPISLAHTLAHAGSSTAKGAVCASDRDTQRIRAEIEASGMEVCGEADRGYELVDRAIRRTTKSTRYTLLLPAILHFFPAMLVQVALVRLCIILPPDGGRVWAACAIICFALAATIASLAMYRLASWREGRLYTSDVRNASAVFCLTGVLLWLLVACLDVADDASIYVMPLLLFGTTFLHFGLSLSVLLLLNYYAPGDGVLQQRFANIVSHVAWYGQFVVVLVAVLGATRMSTLATVGFFTIGILSFLGFPGMLISSAHTWDIRIRNPASTE